MDQQNKIFHEPQLHVAMFPWFAFGHMNAFLHLANELAQRGLRISYLLPRNALIQLRNSNRYPSLISFHVVEVPHVDGLPPGAQTASEIPISLNKHLMTAIDLTRHQVEDILLSLRPDIVFFDFAYWVPEIGLRLGFKTICYNTVSAASIAIILVPSRKVAEENSITKAEVLEPPPGYPSTVLVPRPHEARCFLILLQEFGKGVTFYERTTNAMKQCDAIAIRTCEEIEGKLCEYIGEQYGKPMLLTGPLLPKLEEPENVLDEKWEKWLEGFKPGSVIFCAFGSQLNLEKAQFQELLLGIELTGYPFLLALKPPSGIATVEEAFPEGFEERIRGRGVVYGGWIQQPLILKHRSLGCFVSHCGFGSMWESLASDPQIVLVPHLGDQILNTRLLTEELKVAAEVERDENGWFSKENLCNAIKSVMEEDSEVGQLVKKNHTKLKKILCNPTFLDAYIDTFTKNLHNL